MHLESPVAVTPESGADGTATPSSLLSCDLQAFLRRTDHAAPAGTESRFSDGDRFAEQVNSVSHEQHE